MAQLSFSQIFFAIAMLLLGHGNATKITVSKQGKIYGTWVLQSAGQWRGTDSIETPDADTGLWSFDTGKMILTNHPPALQAAAITIDLSTIIKPGDEKPDPTTLEFNGKALIFTRHGDDIIITAKDPPPGVDLAPITIHYERAVAGVSPTPKPDAAP